MKSKVLINPGKKRRIPRHFSWVDHRLVRSNYLERCSCEALALYLFLLTVGDYEGLSYYRDESILKYLNLSEKASISKCRRELIDAELISYLGGLYQVLDLGNDEEQKSKMFSSALRNHYSRKKLSDSSEKVQNSNNTGTTDIGSVIEKMFGGV
jgi:hypothetical protein